MRKFAPACLALAAGLSIAAGAHAAQGLNGAYYVFGSGPGSLANTETDIAASSGPAATFIGTQICYPNCGGTIDDGSLLSQFLDTPTNANSLSSDVNGLGAHGLVLTGFLNITTAATYAFSMGSDDGSEIQIDNTTVVSNDGDHGFGVVAGNVNLSAGLHAIRIVQFEDGGATGVTVDMNGQALGGNLIQTNGPGGVPEPATWALAVLGVGTAGVALRKRRRIAPATA